MKNYSKFALLVVLVLFLSLTACTLRASTPPPATQAPTGEAPFPVFTPGPDDVSSFGTQTVIAQTPGAELTPQVVVSTDTPSAGPDEAGGGQETVAPQPQTQPQPAANTPVVTRPPTYTLQRGEGPI